MPDKRVEQDVKGLRSWAEAHVSAGSSQAAQVIRVLEDRERLKQEIRELRGRLIYMGWIEVKEIM